MSMTAVPAYSNVLQIRCGSGPVILQDGPRVWKHKFGDETKYRDVHGVWPVSLPAYEPIQKENIYLNPNAVLQLENSKEVSILSQCDQTTIYLTNCDTVFIDIPYPADIRLMGKCKNIDITYVNQHMESLYQYLGSNKTVQEEKGKEYLKYIQIENPSLCENIVVNGIKLV